MAPHRASKPQKEKKSRSRKTSPVKGGRRSRAGHVLYGSNNWVSNVSSVPLAFDNIDGNACFVSAPKGVKHKTLGIEGIQLHGCQPLSDITCSTASELFTATTLATLTTTNQIGLCPDNLNGPLAAQANLHDRYVFRDVVVEYIGQVATTQAGCMAMSIVQDGSSSFGGAPTTFSTTRQCIPNIVVPFRHDRAYLHFHYDGNELFYNKIDSATDAGFRQTIQLTLSGFPSAINLGTNMGFTNIWYVIDLYGPVSTQGFTVGARDKTERDMLEAYLRRLRLDAEPADRFDTCSLSSAGSRRVR